MHLLDDGAGDASVGSCKSGADSSLTRGDLSLVCILRLRVESLFQGNENSATAKAEMT